MGLQRRALPLGSCIPWHGGIGSPGVTPAPFPLLLRYVRAAARVPGLAGIRHVYF